MELTYVQLPLREWDRVNGIAPVLLYICKNRAMLLAERVATIGIPEREADVYRGQRKELLQLIAALEAAHVDARSGPTS